MSLRSRAAFALVPFLLLQAAWSADWPQWRGPNRDNVAPSSPPLATTWPAAGPKKLWEVHTLPVGGSGSVAVAGDCCYLYVHLNQAAKDVGLCVDAKTGKLKWKQELKGESTLQDSSSTPTVVNGKVLLAGAKAGYLLDAATGAMVWRAPYAMGGGWEGDGYEICASFLTVGDMAFTCAGQANAFDLASGQVRWKGKPLGGYASALASPIKWTSGGKDYIVCAGLGLVCYEAATGKEVWNVPGKGPYKYGHSPTLCGSDVLAIIDGELALVRMQADKATIVWKTPFFDDFAAPVVHNKHIYTIGKNTANGQITAACREYETAKLVWETPVPNNEYSSPIIADGKLIALVDKGATLVLIDADPGKAGKVLATATVKALQWTTPSFVDGKVYLRLKDGIACYDLTQAANAPASQ
jgi:outer membrane protein assembly factor BamB